MLDFKVISLLDKPLFTWVISPEPLRLTAAMPSNEACFAYILEGSCVSYSAAEQLVVKTQEAFLARCGNYTTQLLTDGKTAIYSTITVHFHLEVLQKIYEKEQAFWWNKPPVISSANAVKVAVNHWIHHYMEGLQHYFDCPSLLTEELLILKLKELVVLLCHSRNSAEVLKLMSSLFSEQVLTFKTIIDQHICSDLTIEELAQLTNRSLSTFKKDFKKLYHIPPARYILTKRLEKVAALLLTSDDSVTIIAYDCGFKSMAHLSRVFKATYGMPPSQYRLNHTDK